MEKLGGYKTEAKRRDRKTGKATSSVQTEGGRGRTFRGIREVKRRLE